MKHPALLLIFGLDVVFGVVPDEGPAPGHAPQRPPPMPCTTTMANPWLGPIWWTEALEADVVCFGELHDDPIMHWLQQELVRSLFDQGRPSRLGAEMLEADDQLVVDEYLAGWVNLDKLEAAANLWPNHATDYQPLLDLAKEHELTIDRHQRAPALCVVGLQARA